MQNLGGLTILAAAIFIVPALVGRYVIGGSWQQVAVSFGLWFGFLALTLLLPGSGRWGEKFGWMTILSMFLTIVLVPVLTLVQRVAGWGLAKFG